MAVVTTVPSQTNGDSVDPTAQPKLTKQQRKRRNRKKTTQAQNSGVRSTTGTVDEVSALAQSVTLNISGDDSFLDNGDMISRTKARKRRRQRAKLRSVSQGQEEGRSEIIESHNMTEKSVHGNTKVVESKATEPLQIDEPEPSQVELKPSDPGHGETTSAVASDIEHRTEAKTIEIPSPKQRGMEEFTVSVAKTAPEVVEPTSDMTLGTISGEGLEISEAQDSAEKNVSETMKTIKGKSAEPEQLEKPQQAQPGPKPSDLVVAIASDIEKVNVAELNKPPPTKQVEVERSTLEIFETASDEGKITEAHDSVEPSDPETNVVDFKSESTPIPVSPRDTNKSKAVKSLRAHEAVDTAIMSGDCEAIASPNSVAYIDDENKVDVEDCSCAACNIM